MDLSTETSTSGGSSETDATSSRSCDWDRPGVTARQHRNTGGKTAEKLAELRRLDAA